jgi:hypothetical protein
MRHGPIIAILLLGACSRLPWSSRGNAALESLYWRAVTQLDTASTPAGLSGAVSLLDGYLASTRIEHRAEASVMRRYAIAAQQLARAEGTVTTRPVEGEQRTDATKRAEPESRREEDAREIQRLKDELAKANAELERIRKRLANPKDPPS